MKKLYVTIWCFEYQDLEFVATIALPIILRIYFILLIHFNFIILIVKWFKQRSPTGEAISTTYSLQHLKIHSIAHRVFLFPSTYLTFQHLKNIFPSSLLMAHFIPMESILMEDWALEAEQISSFPFIIPLKSSLWQGLQSWNVDFHMFVFN